MMVTCPECNGTKFVYDEEDELVTCFNCLGRGVVLVHNGNREQEDESH